MPEIIAITGLPGAGKTLLSVHWAYRLRRRRPDHRILANFDLVLPGRPVEFYETIEDLLDVEDAYVIMDEAHLLLSNREWNKHGRSVRSFVSQQRKARVDLVWITQSLDDVDQLLKRRTSLSYWIESYRRLGFFVWRSYFGLKPERRKRYTQGFWTFNPKIASCYRTEQRIYDA